MKTFEEAFLVVAEKGASYHEFLGDIRDYAPMQQIAEDVLPVLLVEIKRKLGAGELSPNADFMQLITKNSFANGVLLGIAIGIQMEKAE